MSATLETKPVWTYADLAADLGLSVGRLKHRMRELEAAGFPAPLPYSRRPKRWNAGAVRAWRNRHERRCGAIPLDLVAIEGGL